LSLAGQRRTTQSGEEETSEKRFAHLRIFSTRV
jgi:hypothetical protein